MSIYDVIANPKIPSVLPHLQFMMNMEDRRRRRDYEENQANIQARMAAGQEKGRGHIRAYLEPKEGPPERPTELPPEGQAGSLQADLQAGAQAEGPPPEQTEPGSEQMAATQPTGEQPGGAQPGDISEITAPLQNISTEEISKADNYEALADKIAGIAGNEKAAKTYYDLAEKTRVRTAEQTKEERKRADQLMEVSAGPMKEVSELEEQGTPESMQAAAEKFNEIRDFIMRDPRFAKSEGIKKFFGAYPEYQPGIGKYMYTVSMMGGKARDQQQKEGKQGGIEDRAKAIAERHKDRIKLSEESGKRADTRIKMQEEKQALTERKFDVNTTDKILTAKRQEEKDIKKVKLSLVKALKLAEAGKNFPLVDKLLQQSMSKWENTSVRAYAELERFKGYGDISERIAGHISQFFSGDMTVNQRQMAIETAKSLLNDFVSPVLDESGDYWRRIASERGLDPDQVSPYGSKEEVGEDYRDGIISRETAEKILQKARFK